jgi:hypothetical protein
LIAREHQRLVYRPQGWISAVILADGYLKGVWEYKARAAHTVIKAKMFSPPTAVIRAGIETEAQRLSAFWNSKVVVEYEDQ